MIKHWGSALTSGERVSICRACGGGFIPPAHGNCCSQRCVEYLAVASQPVLGDPMFGPQQPMLCRGGCGLRFESRGLVLCPECYFKARPAPTHECETATCGREAGVSIGTGLAPARTYEPIQDRNPRSRCHW
jgi:hypothetical protein